MSLISCYTASNERSPSDAVPDSGPESELSRPGSGDQGEKCKVPYRFGCWDHQGYFWAYKSCDSYFCPKCYTKAAWREADRAAERLWAWLNDDKLPGFEYKKYTMPYHEIEMDRYEKYHREWGHFSTDPRSDVYDEDKDARRDHLWPLAFYHVVFSFDDEPPMITPDDVNRVRRRARKLADRHGLFGGVSVCHERDEDDDTVHVHMVASAAFIEPATKDMGYIFKVIPLTWPDTGRIKGWARRSQHDIRATIGYLLTHHLVHRNLDSLVYWGCVAPRNFPKVLTEGLVEQGVVERGPATPVCPVCGSIDTFPVDAYKAPGLWASKETWVAPDRPPPGHPQRSITEYGEGYWVPF